MYRKVSKRAVLFLVLFAVSWLPAQAAEPNMKECFVLSKDAPTYSPYVDQEFPDQVLFGDTHVHTSYSTDAGLMFNRLGVDMAYRFARGEEVTSSIGQRAKLRRPLDFLVVSDHAENLGLAPMIAESNEGLLKTEFGRQISALAKGPNPGSAYALWGKGMAASKDPLAGSEALTRSMWEKLTDAAERYNAPGKFTALIGFEWTSSPGGNNLHRNVIFRDSKELTDQVLPFSNYDSQDPEDLWAYMAAYEQKTGGQVLAIPHNGNLSNGMMFDVQTLSGKPLDRDYAERRMRWEPLYEMTQIKGDSEAHPSLSPNDEFADYGTWDKGSFGPQAKTPEMLPKEYAREVLKRGLAFEQTMGVNPFKFGMIGSTDSHTSLATFEEEQSFGKVTPLEPSPCEARMYAKITGYMPNPDGIDIAVRHYQSLASGLAAVWAKENTREALWDAMQRKEVYATTGTRLKVRLFAGWDFSDDEVARPDFVARGYERGVPMGGDLPQGNKDQAPTLMVSAQKDPDGANLDRVQIVKGWLDEQGELHEQVYDVAWAGDRQPGGDGKLPSVGNTVDVAEASYTNTIGSALLAKVWRDPDFDPAQRAFYYARVLEIPTPRWSTYDAKRFGVALPEGVNPSHQERAYTSPIWYSPVQ